MSPEQVLATVEKYRREFKRREIRKADYPHERPLLRTQPALEHCHGMLDKIEAFIQAGRMEKAMRWLGFVQGVLFATGVFTIENLKSDNRSPET